MEFREAMSFSESARFKAMVRYLQSGTTIHTASKLLV
jgi:hypothetical protein